MFIQVTNLGPEYYYLDRKDEKARQVLRLASDCAKDDTLATDSLLNLIDSLEPNQIYTLSNLHYIIDFWSGHPRDYSLWADAKTIVHSLCQEIMELRPEITEPQRHMMFIRTMPARTTQKEDEKNAEKIKRQKSTKDTTKDNGRKKAEPRRKGKKDSGSLQETPGYRAAMLLQGEEQFLALQKLFSTKSE